MSSSYNVYLEYGGLRDAMFAEAKSFRRRIRKKSRMILKFGKDHPDVTSYRICVAHPDPFIYEFYLKQSQAKMLGIEGHPNYSRRSISERASQIHKHTHSHDISTSTDTTNISDGNENVSIGTHISSPFVNNEDYQLSTVENNILDADASKIYNVDAVLNSSHNAMEVDDTANDDNDTQTEMFANDDAQIKMVDVNHHIPPSPPIPSNNDDYCNTSLSNNSRSELLLLQNRICDSNAEGDMIITPQSNVAQMDIDHLETPSSSVANAAGDEGRSVASLHSDEKTNVSNVCGTFELLEFPYFILKQQQQFSKNSSPSSSSSISFFCNGGDSANMKYFDDSWLNPKFFHPPLSLQQDVLNRTVIVTIPTQDISVKFCESNYKPSCTSAGGISASSLRTCFRNKRSLKWIENIHVPAGQFLEKNDDTVKQESISNEYAENCICTTFAITFTQSSLKSFRHISYIMEKAKVGDDLNWHFMDLMIQNYSSPSLS